MDSAVWGFIGVLLGSIITGVVTIGGEILRGRQESELDAKKRSDDRRIESNRLQRDTLLELQERFTEWVRAVSQIHMQDRNTLNQHGDMFLLPERVSQQEFEIGRRALYLQERVLNDELRAALEVFRANAADAAIGHVRDRDSVTVERLEGEFNRLMFEGIEVQRKIGSVLRTYL